MNDKQTVSDISQQDIIDLQTQLQFQEDTLHKLDAIIVKQDERIAKLSERMKQLEDKLTELAKEQNSSTSIEQEKPPHY